MIKLYLKQAWELLKQNKLFSTLYIVGTALAIAMTVVMAVIYYVKIAPIYPEVNRPNTLYLKGASFKKGELSNQQNVSWALSYQALQEWCYPVKNAVAVSAYAQNDMALNSFIQPIDRSGDFPVVVKLTDPAFFQIYSFRFLDGEPFTQADLEGGVCTAVITDDLARRLFGKTDGVVGQTFSLNYVSYRVCGVVRSASYLTEESFSQVYVPYSVSSDYRKSQYGCPYLGMFYVTFLVEDDAQGDALRAEVAEIQRKFNLIGEETKDWQVELYDKPIPHIENVFRQYNNVPVTFWDVFRKVGLVVLVLLIVPAINLSGMISSRMDVRIAEMGVRKTFGASRSSLLSQVMWENLLLTLLGGLLGLVLAWIGIFMSKGWIFSLMDRYGDVPPGGVEVSVTGEMLFAPAVFLAALLLCVVMNVLSALLPAWWSLKKPIVQSLFEKR